MRNMEIQMSRLTLICVIAGIVLIATGDILISCIHFLDEPEGGTSSFYGNTAEDNKEQRAYESRVNRMNGIGEILGTIGMSILGVGLVTGALSDEKLPKNVRVGMMIAFGVVIGIQMRFFSAIN